jgi:putative acetyltransferase
MIEVRTVTASDVPEVVKLVADVLGEFGLAFGQGSQTDNELYELPASYSQRGGAFWVAYRGNELLGTCGVFPLSSTMFELRKMYLRPASRGSGIGKRMLETAIEWSRTQKASHVVLDTTHEMTRAIAFYESHGFVRDDAHIRGARCSRGYVRTL